jgi:LPPG:FO 2-phospho-L-lactate transferase
MLDVVGPENLVVIANTGDDVEIYGAYVSPDPDLVTFWLADLIDDRGWGLAGDTFAVMNGMRDVGIEIWFNLGDRDLALGLERARMLRAGHRLTDAHAALARSLGVTARVLPMTDQPVRTRVRAQGRWWSFQEFMIRGRGEGPVQDMELRGARAASPTPEVLSAIETAQAVIVGPSNPIVSIGPILAVRGIEEALKRTAAPRVAVSPIVHGEVVKGPTAPFMEWAGHLLSSDGVAARRSCALHSRSDSVDARCVRSRSCRSRALARRSSGWRRISMGLRGGRWPRRCSPMSWSRWVAVARSIA